MKNFSLGVLIVAALFTSGFDISKTYEQKGSAQPIKQMFAVAKEPTPILYTSDFEAVYGGRDRLTLRRNSSGLIKELETVALTGTVFEILDTIPKKDHSIYKIITKEYTPLNPKNSLYIDSRCVTLTENCPPERNIAVPSVKAIYKFFDKIVKDKVVYVWGANTTAGVPNWLKYYPPAQPLAGKTLLDWSIKGLDCSGVIYEATNGFTLRNTHQLVYYGKPVMIQGLTAAQIAAKLDSLDMIVYKGHIVYVFDKKTTIESSCSAGGIIKKDLVTHLTRLMGSRRAVNEWSDNGSKQFVIRRWKHMINP
jgi:hypothetical protein